MYSISAWFCRKHHWPLLRSSGDGVDDRFSNSATSQLGQERKHCFVMFHVFVKRVETACKMFWESLECLQNACKKHILPLTFPHCRYFMFVLLSCITSVIGNAWGYLASVAGGRTEYAFAIFLLAVFPFWTAWCLIQWKQDGFDFQRQICHWTFLKKWMFSFVSSRVLPSEDSSWPLSRFRSTSDGSNTLALSNLSSPSALVEQTEICSCLVQRVFVHLGNFSKKSWEMLRKSCFCLDLLQVRQADLVHSKPAMTFCASRFDGKSLQLKQREDMILQRVQTCLK